MQLSWLTSIHKYMGLLSDQFWLTLSMYSYIPVDPDLYKQGRKANQINNICFLSTSFQQYIVVPDSETIMVYGPHDAFLKYRDIRRGQKS